MPISWRVGSVRVWVGLAFLFVVGCKPPTHPDDAWEANDHSLPESPLLSEDEPVEFAFGWPDATATVTLVNEKARYDGTIDRKTKARYTLHTQRRRGGTLLVVTDFEALGSEGRLHPEGDDMAEPGGLLPSGTIKARGGRLVPSDMDVMRDAFLKLQRSTRDSEQQPSASAQGLIDAVATDEGLRTAADNTWRTLVGHLVRARLDPRRPLERRTKAKLPLPGDLRVVQVTTTSVEPNQVCSASAESLCVRVTVDSDLADSAAVAAAIQDIAEELQLGPGKVDAVDFRGHVEELIEAGTLRPHHIEVSKDIRVVVYSQGERRELGQRQRWSLDFEWRQ